MMLKNFLFYAFSTFINTWTAEKGGGEVFRVFGIASLALMALCIPMCKSSPPPRVFHDSRQDDTTALDFACDCSFPWKEHLIMNTNPFTFPKCLNKELQEVNQARDATYSRCPRKVESEDYAQLVHPELHI